MPPPNTPRPPPAEETRRQAALEALSVLDTGPEPALDALVQAAAALCAAPVSLISLVDRERQWFKANWGLPGLQATPRSMALCALTILDEDGLVIPNTRDDARSRHNPLVTGEPHISFYAGVPLHAPGGERIGALCVIDQTARDISPQQLQGLRHLATAASEWLRQRCLYERTPAMLHSIDAEGRLLSVSDQWLSRLGYPREAVLGRPSTDFLSPESARRAQQEVLPAFFASGRCERVPYEMRTRDGRPVHVELSAILERDAAGRPLRSMAILEDVTRRREAESALAEEHQRLANVVAATEAGTWEWHVPSGETRFDERWAAMLGWSLADLEPHTVETWRRLVHPADLPAAEAALQAHFAGAARHYAVDLRMRHRQGHWVWVQARGGVSRWLSAGQPEWIFGIHLDVSAAKAQELTLRRTQDLLARASAVAGLGAWEVDLQTRQMSWSDHLRRLLDLTPTTTASWTGWLGLCAAPQRAALSVAMDKAAGQGSGFDLELPFCRADGQTVWLRVVGSAEGQGGAPTRLIGTVQDIGARKQAEHALEAARQRAEAASRAKGDFLASMSHEIRNPLNAVQGYVYLLAQTPLSAEQDTLLGKLRQASQATLDSINDVLDLAKIEANELALVQEPTQLITLLQSAYSICEVQARHNGVRLQLQLPEDMPLVWADTKRLRQVVLNLLGNAVKFTAQGEVNLALRWQPVSEVEHRSPTPQLEITIDVTDTGIGMSPDTQSRIFEPFYQADDAEARYAGGTGLGLAIVRRLVTLMQGQIEIHSRVSEGTRFRVHLRLPVAQAPERVLRPALLGRTRVLEGLHVLVADDSAMNRDVASGILMLHGARVTQAADGVEALKLAERGVDLVLMDLQMPQMDGLGAARTLKQALGDRCPPIVALTGAATLSDQREALDAGMCGFITKPVDAGRLPLELLRALRALPALGDKPAEGPSKPSVTSVPSDPGRHTAVSHEAHGAPAGWPRLTGLDTAAAARRMCGDQGLFARSLEQLLEEGPRCTAWLRALTPGEAQPSGTTEDTPTACQPTAAKLTEQAMRATHRLHGMAGNIGATELQRCLAHIEETLRKPRPTPEVPMLDTLHGLLGLLESQARPWLVAQAASLTPQPMARAPAVTPSSTLAELRSLLEHRNLRAIHALQHLSPDQLDALSDAEQQRLRSLVQALRFDEALRCLDPARATQPVLQ